MIEFKDQKVIIPFETGENTPQVNIDCTGIINSVMDACQQGNNKEMAKTNTAIELQQKQMEQVLTTVGKLIEATNNKGLNTPDGVLIDQPKIKMHNNTPEGVSNYPPRHGIHSWIRSLVQLCGGQN